MDVGYKLSVFITPPRHRGLATEFQHKTIRSLIYLNPKPKVFLLGNHSSFYELAYKYKRWNVKQERFVDETFTGVPLFSSVFSRALGAQSDLSMVLSSDVAFVNALALKSLLEAAYSSAKRFLILSPILDLQNLPPQVTKAPSARRKKRADDLLHILARQAGKLETHSGAGAYLWNNDWSTPFFNASMPPFPSRQGDRDTWLAHTVLRTTDRLVVEAGRALTCVAVRDIRKYAGSEADGGSEDGSQGSKGSDLWLSQGRGRATEGGGEVPESVCPTRKPKIALPCSPASKETCFSRVVCSCEEKSLEVRGERQEWLCNAVSPKPYVDAILAKVPAARRSRFRSVEELLPSVSDENNVVVLVAVSARYSDMLMNFVCNLRRLRLRDPLVAALDPVLYRFADAQGLPVYLERPSEELKQKFQKGPRNSLEAKCTFGSTCFRQLTKLKSRAVLRILRLGHHVLWTDVDIFWFRSPMPEMLASGPGTFPVQCDEWNTSIPPSGLGFPESALFGTINSGFYFARAERRVVEAFEAIIEHAALRMNQSEQPSFYKVLCGEAQEFVASGTECVWRNGLRTLFLDRELHPNGRVFRLWRSPTVSRCRAMGCASLHNNWIKGMDRKTLRFKKKSMWNWDEYNRICRYEWYGDVRGLVKAHWKYGAGKLVFPGSSELE